MKKIVLKTAVIAALLLSASSPFPKQAHALPAGNAVVLATSLNVRSEPAQKASIVGSLPYGAVVSVSGEAYGWAQISSGQTKGWVAGQYLKKTNAAARSGPAAAPSAGSQGSAKSGQTGTVLADALRMRSGPGLDQGILRVLPMNTTVDIISQQNSWLRIRTSSGETGWVSAEYIGKKKQGATAASISTSGAKPKGKPGLKGKLIVIDAGHGGNDVGAIGTKYGVLEKTVNLQTASRLADLLRQKGARVVMTRTGDKQNPALHDRVAVSESRNADAFVSIHYNSSPKNVSGTLTFFYSEQKDMPLARAIEAHLGELGGMNSNGISFGNYHVLRENDQPAVLLELGFLTNSKDESLARTADYQRRSAQAIAEGLADYFGG